MRFRNLDENEDFTFGKGINNYSIDTESIKLNIATRLRSWKNDCFFALNEGVDWNTYLSTGQINLLAEQIRAIIIQTPGVAELIEFDFSLTNRTFLANYTTRTIYSENFQDSVSRLV